MAQSYFAFVRNLQTQSGANIKSFGEIQGAEKHAKRKDKTSQARQVEGRSHEANYFWSKAGESLEGGGADYAKAYRAHKKENGVKTERKGAAIGQHLLVGVSPEWLAEGGDPRDTNNKRVRQLITEAKAWAESWMGEGAVWAVRYDTDEKGAGIVDILASPIREQRHKSGSSKPVISVSKANKELAAKHGVMKSWEAMQTSWADHAQKTLDEDLQRGEPKKETEREHVSPEAYSAAVEVALEDAESAARDFTDLLTETFTTRHADLTKTPLAEPPSLSTYNLLYTGWEWGGSGKDDLQNSAAYFIHSDLPYQQSRSIDDLAYQTPEACLEAFKDREAEFFGKSRAEIAEKDRSVYQMVRDFAVHNSRMDSPLRGAVIHAVGSAILNAMNGIVDFYQKSFEAARHQAHTEAVERAEALDRREEDLKAREGALRGREGALVEREEAVEIAESTVEFWAGFDEVPEPVQQATNHYLCLQEAISEHLDDETASVVVEQASAATMRRSKAINRRHEHSRTLDR